MQTGVTSEITAFIKKTRLFFLSMSVLILMMLLCFDINCYILHVIMMV